MQALVCPSNDQSTCLMKEGEGSGRTIIQFAPFSVQEYLCSSRAFKYKVEEQIWGHSLLSCSCSAYLVFIRKRLGTSPKVLKDDITRDMAGILDPYDGWVRFRPVAELLSDIFPLLRYPAAYWFYYTQYAGDISNITMDELLNSLFLAPIDGLLGYIYITGAEFSRFVIQLSSTELRRTWIPFNNALTTQMMKYLISFGMNRQKIISLLGHKLIPIPENNELVIVAVDMNHPDTIKLLIQAGFPIEEHSCNFRKKLDERDVRRPLRRAIKSCSPISIVRVLLDARQVLAPFQMSLIPLSYTQYISIDLVSYAYC